MSYFPRVKNDDGEVNILLVSTILFGIIALIFSVTSIYAVLDSQNAHKTLAAAKSAAYQTGQDDQKKQDVIDQQKANQSPFRSYKTNSDFGRLEINFPKNWNAWVNEDVNSSTQINLVLNPDFIKIIGNAASKGNNYAFRAMLLKQNSETLKTGFDQRVKTKQLSSKSVKVSGITSTWYEGAFDATHTGVIVIIPVRDKTVEFMTDYSKDYLNEFNQILAQAVIPS